MAEAVLVIDANGEILLSNPAAEKMLRYQAGMTVEQVRSLSTAFQADGVTPLPGRDLPAARALRGEAFDNKEIVARRALAEGVVLAPGNVFSANQAAGRFLRFNVAQSGAPRLTEVLRRAMEGAAADRSRGVG